MAEDPSTPQEKPKIVIDDDWKSQAEAEKKRLAEEVDRKKAAASAGAIPSAAGGPGSQAAAGERGVPRQLPPASFSTLISFLATQAMLSLGGMRDRRTGAVYVDLDAAKHYVDSIAILEQKTKGNLTDEEKKLLDQVLYEVRMHYVEMAQRATMV